jgi:hypothetical protein
MKLIRCWSTVFPQLGFNRNFCNHLLCVDYSRIINKGLKGSDLKRDTFKQHISTFFTHLFSLSILISSFLSRIRNEVGRPCSTFAIRLTYCCWLCFALKCAMSSASQCHFISLCWIRLDEFLRMKKNAVKDN